MLDGRRKGVRSPSPPVAAVPLRTAAPSVPARLRSLQHTVGNRAVARLVSSRMRPGPRRLARLKWKDTDTVKESALSAQLTAGLTLARTYPDASPPRPGWVDTVIKAGMDYDKQVADWEAAYKVKSQPSWDKLPDKAKAKYGNVDSFALAGWARPRAAFVQGLDASVASIRAELKWNQPFNNDNGDLPGTAGAGGYREYYAEPNPAHVGPTAGTWGRNRVLRKVNDDGGYRDHWWVTDDHYASFKLVVP